MISVTVSFLALIVAFIALAFAIVMRRASLGSAREELLRGMGDPTQFTVVSDGKFFRVRGPFDTFYTGKFHKFSDALKYAQQLAHYYRHEAPKPELWQAVHEVKEAA